MPSCNTYCLTWVSFTLDMGNLFTLLLTLDEGYLLTTTPHYLERRIAPLGPPGLVQPPLFGHGVAPPGHRPWPRAWGSFSQLHFVCWSHLALASNSIRCSKRELYPYMDVKEKTQGLLLFLQDTNPTMWAVPSQLYLT